MGTTPSRWHVARHLLGRGVAPHRRRPRFPRAPPRCVPTSAAPCRSSWSLSGPVEASRKAEQARTADIADSELRRRGGFLATARRRKEEEILARREVELADGHAQYRFSGYITVSAPDPDALEEACGRVEQAAGQAGLELRRCYGDQANTFMCTLPLGRGLA